MKLSYRLDISEKSEWLVQTPGDAARRLPFYLLETGHFYSGPDYFTERSGRRAFYLLYTVSGAGRLQIPDGEFILRPGSAVLIDCEKYQLYRTQTAPWDNLWLHFSGRAAREYFRLVNPGAVTPLTPREPESFAGLMAACRAYFQLSDIRTNAAASLHVTRLLTALIDSRLVPARPAGEAEADFGAVERAIFYMKQHLDAPLRLDTLARVATLSKYHFIRRFRAATGSSPYNYLIHLRVSRAKELLVTSRLPVADVAAAVGFSGAGNFIKAFRNATGRTPAEYRKSM